MSARPAIELKPRTFLELLDLTFAVYKRDFLLYSAISAVIAVPVGLVMFTTVVARQFIGEWARSLLYLCMPLFQYGYSRRNAAMLYAAGSRLMGRPCAWRAAYDHSSEGFWESTESGCGRGVMILIGGGLCLVVVVLVAILLELPPLAIGAAIIATFVILSLVSSYTDAPRQLISAIKLFEGTSDESATRRCQTLAGSLPKQLFLRGLWLDVMFWVVLFVPIWALSLVAMELGLQSFGYQVDLASARLDGGLITVVVALTLSTSLSVPVLSIYHLLTYIDLRVRVENLDLEVLAGSPLLADVWSTEDKPPLHWWRTELVTQDTGDGAIQASSTPSPVVVLLQQIEREGENAGNLGQLGAAYRQVGNWDNALATLRRAQDLQPHNPDVALELTAVYHDLRRFDEMHRMIDQCRQLGVPDDELRRVVCVSMAKEGE